MMGALGALGGLAQGFAQGRMWKQDRLERQEMMKAMDGMGAGRPKPSDSGAKPGGDGGLSFGPAVGAMGAGGLFDLTARTEGAGRADTLFGHSQMNGPFKGVDVSQMTIGEALEFADPSGPYGQYVASKVGRVATPMGKHQIVGTTLRRAAEQMGLPLDTRFDGSTQDAVATHLARNRLAGARSPAAKRAALRAEWEGFKSVSDSELDAAIQKFEADGGVMQPRPLGVSMGAWA